MNHDATHCADFYSDCPMKCYRAELGVDLRSKWTRFIGKPLSYAHVYGTEECKRDSYHKESEVEE